MLGCAEGRTDRDVASPVDCHPATCRSGGTASRSTASTDSSTHPGPGAARTISDENVEAVVVETLETGPPGATHRSTRSLAEDQPRHRRFHFPFTPT